MPHVTGEAFLTELGRARSAALAHALTDLDFADPAKRFGPTGGARHLATIIKAIRAELLPAFPLDLGLSLIDDCRKPSANVGDPCRTTVVEVPKLPTWFQGRSP